MLGEVGIEALQVPCVIGCLEEERHKDQLLLMDLKLKIDLGPAAVSDDLSQTLDYTQVASLCRQVAEQGRYHLIEALANAILERLLPLPGVLWAWIRVRKPGAVAGAVSAFVELERVGGLVSS